MLQMECIACHSPLIDGAAFCPKCGLRQPDAPSYDNFDFSAFISYRHRSPDTAVEEKTARAIETYRLPRAIAHSYGGPKLGRTFRDQDELPATASLPAVIREAIKRSSSLIVVCSPSTPASKWVEGEIEMFASFHGRERIFAVLAEGATSESLPETLKTRIIPDANGVLRCMPAEPLAADMRPEAASSFNHEKLRIIAAIAGCGYDDLRNRERSRKRKRAAIIAITLAIVAAAIVGLGLQWTHQLANAQIEESHRLASKSQMLFEQGDRLGAIEAALGALPSSTEASDRPFVADAQLALEQALEVYPSPTPRQSAFAIDSAVSGDSFKIGLTPDKGAWLAVKDNSASVRIFGLEDGLQKAECALPLADGAVHSLFKNEELFPIENAVISVSSLTERPAYCIDAETGAINWEWGNGSPIAAALSPDGYLLGVLGKSNDSVLALSVLDVKTGRERQSIDLAGQGSTIDPQGTANIRMCFSEQGDAILFAAPGQISRVELGSSEVRAVSASVLPQVQSVDCDGGMVIVCSFTQATPERVQTGIEVRDENLEKLWDRQLFHPTVHLENGNATPCQPRFWYSDSVDSLEGKTQKEKSGRRALVFSADTYIAFLAADDGEPLGTISGGVPAICVKDDGLDMVAVWADGRITDSSFPLSSGFRESDSLTTKTQGPLISAQIASSAIVMKAADAKRGLSCYKRYWSYLLPNVGRIQRLDRGYFGKVNDISRSLPGFCQSCDWSRFAFLAGLHNRYLTYINSNNVLGKTSNRPSIDLGELTGVNFESAKLALRFSNTNPDLVYLFTIEESKAPQLWAIDLISQELAGHYEFVNHPSDKAMTPELAYQLAWIGIDSASDEALCFPDSANGVTVVNPYSLEVVADYATTGSPGVVIHVAKGEGALVVEKATASASGAGGVVIGANACIEIVDSVDGEPIDCQVDDYYVSLSETNTFNGFELNKRGDRLLVACNDGYLRCFSLPDGRFIWEKTFDCASSQYINFLRDDESLIITRDESDAVSIVDANSGKEICSVSSEPGSVLSCRMSADGKRVHLITQKNQFAPSVLQTFAFDGRSLGMVSKVYYAYALSQDESRIVACDGWGEFNIPRYTLDELTSLGRALLDDRN